VVTARRAYISQEITGKDPSTLIIFITVLLAVLLSMAVFRTPAVALMPDVTPKPLRSKANAIINLMGTLGGSLVLGLGIIFGTGATKNTYMSYIGFFCAVAGIMIICLFAIMLTVRERRFVREMEDVSREYGVDEQAEGDSKGERSLSRGELGSLILLLASVALWYAGYNAVVSKYSVYAGSVLNLDYNSTLLIANVAALASYIPVGIIASKVGRKKTIIAGVLMLGTSFLVASFLGNGTPLPIMMVLFSLAGIGWATINVNSFPMVVELARGGNVGRYTGFYYTASMAAQIVTPLLSGYLMDQFGMRNVLFPYAAIATTLAFITMLFVRHGDAKPMAKSGLEALDVDD
jgi:MFS family permease